MPTVLDRISTSNADRIPENRELKYAAMCENMFRFFRGSCHLFYEDLAAAKLTITSPPAWICGDLHLENFGSYLGDNRLVYFDINDFDEGILAPAHWEIVRLLTSLHIAFEVLGIENHKVEKLKALLLKSYTETLRKGKAGYIEQRTARGIICDFLKQADLRSYKEVLDKKTVRNKKMLSIDLDKEKHLPISTELKAGLIAHLQHWLNDDEKTPYNYEVIDCAFRLAGTGSLGVHRYVILLKSTNKAGSKYLLLDMKEAKPSSLKAYVEIAQPQWQSESDRVLRIQNMMQNREPALFSHTLFRGINYIVQELQPVKDSINFKLLKKKYRAMCEVIRDMGMLTASAQLRSSGRMGSAVVDDLITFGADDNALKALNDYATQYAITVKADYKQFCDAIMSP